MIIIYILKNLLAGETRPLDKNDCYKTIFLILSAWERLYVQFEEVKLFLIQKNNYQTFQVILPDVCVIKNSNMKQYL